MSHMDKSSRETGIRTVTVRGVAVSISNQRGALLIVAPSYMNGRRVTIKGRANDDNTRGVSVSTTIGEHSRGGKKQYVAVSPRLLPGNYYADAGSSHGFDEFTIDSNYVTQMHWTY